MLETKEYLTKEDMIKLDKELNLIPLTFDFMFKGIFMNNLEILKEFIIYQLDMNLNSNECKIELLNSELPKENKKEYKKTVDIYVSINNYIYTNIEVNREYFKDVKGRNMLFADKLYSMMLKQGKNISELNKKIFVQINLNAMEKLDKNKSKISIGSDRVVMFGLDSNQIYTENKFTLVKYLEYYRNIYYNEDNKLSKSEKWLVVLTSRNFKELYDLLGNVLDEEKRDTISEWEMQKLDELVEVTKHENAIKEGRELGIQQGIKEGIQQGIQQNKIEVVTNMLNKNLDIDLISEISGISEEEIIKISESL